MDQQEKNGGPALYINHLCNPNCDLVEWGVDSLPRMCIFAKKKIKSGMEFIIDYSWELVSRQFRIVCLCGSDNCDGYIDKKKDAEKKLGGSEYDIDGILRCLIQFRK